MLEIIALIFLTRKIGDLATLKGVKPSTWKMYTVLAWISFEIIGLVIGMMIFPNNTLLAILVAIPCAIAGYHLVKVRLEKLPDVHSDIDEIGSHLDTNE
ncbi:MAG: hypothetical protein R2831_12935 [Chitinophagaceae bacterium]